MYSTEFFSKISEGFEKGEFTDLLSEIQCDGLEKVIFRYSRDPLLKEAALQCHIRDRYRHKFQIILHRYPGWLFPPGLPLQQASHHLAANCKAKLAGNFSRVIDLTGGLGMDAIAFADQADSVVYLELNQEIYKYNAHNFLRYIPHIKPILADSIQWIRDRVHIGMQHTLLYADPARRTTSEKQTFHLKNYLPDPFILSKLADEKSLPLLIKMSPMTDLDLVASHLGGLSEVHLLAVQNELKEILILQDRHIQNPHLKIWLCGTQGNVLLFESDRFPVKGAVKIRNAPFRYLYLPHPALIKARADLHIAAQEALMGFHPEARVYTSDTRKILQGWRIFEVLDFASSLSHMNVKEAMIVTGKFPEKPDVIRKRHKIPESNSDLLVVTKTLKNDNLWILAKKLFD